MRLAKHLLPCFILCLFCFPEASSARFQSADAELTTFILVRHAEKIDNSRDTDLSAAGYERADRLDEMLSESDINAIYSTDLKRTRKTVEKISETHQLSIEFYGVQSLTELAAEWINRHQGETVIVSGHSNTTPELANALLGRHQFNGPFDEADYDNLLIITVTLSGEARLLHLTY